jgi:hypothetical protein
LPPVKLLQVELPPVELPPVELPPVNPLPANQAMARWKVWNPAPPQEKRKLEPGKAKTKRVEEFA